MNVCTLRQDHSPDPCDRLRTWNFISAGAFAATYATHATGVIDALLRFDDGEGPDDNRLSLAVFPNGAWLSMRL